MVWVMQASAITGTVDRFICESECKRIHALRRPIDALLSTSGRILIRHYFNSQFPAWFPCLSTPILKRSSRNRPYLSHPLEFPDFNVSHHGDYCVFASSSESGSRIGVDIMCVEVPGVHSQDVFLNSMRRSLSQLEWNDVASLSSSPYSQLERFYTYWTLKEALLKAIGIGIELPMNHLEFTNITSGRIICSFQPEVWYFKLHKVGGSILAIATDSDTYSYPEPKLISYKQTSCTQSTDRGHLCQTYTRTPSCVKTPMLR